MNIHSFVRPQSHRRCQGFFPVLSLAVILLVLFALPGRAQDRQWLPRLLPAAATNAPLVRPFSRGQQLNLSISLPLRNRTALNNLLQQLYDPASTNYHRFLTPEQFAQNFGPTPEDYAAVVKFARTHGLIVTARYSNRTLVSVRGMVGDIERAFQVNLNEYQHPTEARTFRAPDAAPSLDLAVPVLSVNGLDDYIRPHATLHPLTLGQASPAVTGSGPSGTYLGKDFRAAYVPGVSLTGAGQTVGLLEFDSGYYPADIAAYETLAGLPNVPVTPVLLDGYGGGAGVGNDEVSLDIEMAISMAPGLDDVLVYEGSTTDDILNRMATDDLARQLSASWTYAVDPESDQIFLQFAAQGQSFFNASGDTDAYAGTPAPPTDDPNITIVGGTTLTTTGPAGAWAGETVWNWGDGQGSSGGISTSVPIPAWQTGIDMTANEGSTTLRNLPDVAMVADNVYVAYGDGKAGDFGGTSCATPLWASLTALINELALTNHQAAMGFLNPAVYAIGKGSNAVSYASLFHDTTNGNNYHSASPTRFAAVPGYDLCTGWGTPQGSNLISALALPEPLVITPDTGVLFSGPVGGPFLPASQYLSLTNHAAGTLNWSLGNTSVWFTVDPVGGSLANGGAAALVSVGVTPLATSLPPGSYTATLSFTNLTDNFGQTRRATLAVVTPPVITAQPVSQALLEGQTASFSVSVGTNALVYYQWLENGTNLTDHGNLSGSATSTLTLTSITFTNVAAYSVIVSNAAGVAASSNAYLSIIPSAPVIVAQPTNQTVLPGAPATFGVSVVGNEPYGYHWQLNGTNLAKSAAFSAVTNASLTVNNAAAANAGIYSVTISNTLGQITSTGAVLALIPITPPNVTIVSLATLTNSPGAGAYPYSALAQGRDGNFYGSTIEGGLDSFGTLFKVTPNGVLSTVVSFTEVNGAIPYGGLVLAKNGAFYGVCESGGTYSDGTTFEYVAGGALTTLTSFNGYNGAAPIGGLTQGADNFYYGTTLEGGPYGVGSLYRLSGGIGSQTNLIAFDGTHGAYPSPVLVQGSDGNFYGTTENGGTFGNGTVFKVSPAGAFTVLYNFTGLNDGAVPVAGLVAGVDGNFYGTTYLGGSNAVGTVFKITPTGTLTTLWAFTGGQDGEEPWGGLVQARDGNLYGTAQAGGTYGFGTAFQISPTGQFTPLVQFDDFIGAEPSAALVQGTDGNLYGTTEAGGSAQVGTIFRLAISGPLQITGQPVNQPVYVGDNALFTVATSGSSPVAYQWQEDGINLTNGPGISGANSATLIVSNVSIFDAAIYSVMVSNSFNSLNSADALLEVIYSPPDITAQPVSQSVVVGTTATLSVTAVGDAALGYQWLANGVPLTNGGNIFGTLTSTLVISNATPANAAVYSVIVSNGLFTAASSPATLAVVPAVAPGAALTNLHLFTGGIDGAYPFAGLVQGRDNNLYGTTTSGGGSYQGANFRLSLAGNFTTLYTFDYGTGGEQPYAPLVQGTNADFYGTTAAGGTNSYGTLYQMTLAGGVTFLYNFADGLDGANPETGLAIGADGNLYGTTLQGGADAFGSIYRLTTRGAFTNVLSFSGGTNGAYPDAALTAGPNGTLYGTTAEGGPAGDGTVFSLATNGTLTLLATFNLTNGALPEAGVTLGADGRLYGTTTEGGTSGYGTVFSLSTNGGLSTLYSFGYTNGAYPAAALARGVDGSLYGTTSAGGAGGEGTVFKITTNGGLTTLVWFDGLNGASPQGTLVQAANGVFYGTTPEGGNGYNPSIGSGGNGTVFRLTVPTFISSPFPAADAIASLPYAGNITNQAIAPAGDPLSFAKVSGPAWLQVAANGLLSGTPANSDIGTNLFVVSLTDASGISAAATLQLVVIADPPPHFLANPLTEPWAVTDVDYAGSLATNAAAPYIYEGDILAFAKVSGPDWLKVGPDGTLSGTPEGSDGGTNAFVVSVTDLGGASNTATLYLYVALPPAFAAPVFAGAPAIAGIPYAGTVLTNTIDPAGAAGDTLTFYKVTGPAWLTIATNGGLSGTPTSTNFGVNSFLVLVVDSVGLSAVGTLDITVSSGLPPVFLSNPLVGAAVPAGQPYSLALATNVTDPSPGDLVAFAKISGPAWLSVATNGSVTGIPYSINGGTNSFVVSATDLTGLSAQATLLVNVTTEPVTLAIAKQGPRLELYWSGGVPPWQVQYTTNLTPPVWLNLGSPTTTTNRLQLPAAPATYYRVQAN